VSELFGELYLASTKPFLSEAATAADVEFLTEHLGAGPVLDIGCGHGRHLALLAKRGDVLGVDLDALSLREAKRHAPVVQADFFQMPFRSAAIGAAYAWYNTLFTFSDEQIQMLLREVARCVRPGGRLIVQNSNVAKAMAEPTAKFDGTIDGGTHLLEETRFDVASSRDHVHRILTFADGRRLEAKFSIRYYRLDALRAVLQEAGFEVTSAHGSPEGGGQPFVFESSTDLIVGAERRA
jgi:SAM-dependent methyltransferase